MFESPLESPMVGCVQSKSRKPSNIKGLREYDFWSIWDSNPRPFECHSNALPTALMPHDGT